MERESEGDVMESSLRPALRQPAVLQERQIAALIELAQGQVEDWALLQCMLLLNPAGQLLPTSQTDRYVQLQM